jgi:Mor family transcriptional regulator
MWYVWRMSKHKHMTFDEWCAASGEHYTALAEKFGLSVSQIYRIRAKGTKRPRTAFHIEAVTKGKVRAFDLMQMEPSE